MIVGFTGTRLGMNLVQSRHLIELLTEDERLEDDSDEHDFHHGDCIGSDAKAFVIARQLGWRTVAHPGLSSRLRANTESDEIRTPLGFAERNRMIVDESMILLATPNTEYNINRSGTWSTIRYARRIYRPILILLPSGKLEVENL